MKKSKVLLREITGAITLEDAGEAEAIAYLVMEHVFGLSKTEILGDNRVKDENAESQIREIVARINTHEPVQYVLGEAWFCDLKFKVAPGVLIPRPETEGLVRIARSHLKGRSTARVLDIGTGSGCIAIAIAMHAPDGHVTATDLSERALEIARENATRHNVKVIFRKHDILQEAIPLSYDVIVSNPPYIPQNEKRSLAQNVTAFEPATALFVPDDDPLLFYKAIAAKAFFALNPGGLLAVEIHENFSKGTADLFSAIGFGDVQILFDEVDKPRFVSGWKN